MKDYIKHNWGSLIWHALILLFVTPTFAFVVIFPLEGMTRSEFVGFYTLVITAIHLFAIGGYIIPNGILCIYWEATNRQRIALTIIGHLYSPAIALFGYLIMEISNKLFRPGIDPDNPSWWIILVILSLGTGIGVPLGILKYGAFKK